MPTSYRLDEGAWLSADKSSGEGRGQVAFTAPAWTGREDRLTVRVVRSGKNMQAVSIRQLGIVINDIPTDVLEFPLRGGDKQIMITTNAASLIALTTSDVAVKGYIKAFTTASGLSINVNDTRLEYGFPGDPGLESEFQVSIIVSLPDNSDGDEVNEYITINGVMIKIHQPGRVVPFLNLDKEFEEVDGTDSTAKLEIDSNLEDYVIEIVECEQSEETDLQVVPDTVDLNGHGDPQQVSINVKPNDMSWRVV